MAGSRKPSPKHITRYEREDYGSTDAYGNPWRFSKYDHGVKVPAEYADEIRRNGFVRVEETMAEQWGRVLDEHENEKDSYRWTDEYRRHVERMAGQSGLYSVRTWTVGHIVWPGKEDEVCSECSHGGKSVILHKGEMILPPEENVR